MSFEGMNYLFYHQHNFFSNFYPHAFIQNSINNAVAACCRFDVFRMKICIVFSWPNVKQFQICCRCCLKLHVINMHSHEVLLHSAVTSRPPRTGEVNGEQYTFVTRAEMERDILNKR